MHQKTINIKTNGRGTLNISDQIQDIVKSSGIETGLCHIFVHHTSASLMLCENADPDVRTDLETFMSRLVPDGDPMFIHTMEGPDDMPAHIKSVLSGAAITIPVVDGHLALGTWQGIFLCEFRDMATPRKLIISIIA